MNRNYSKITTETTGQTEIIGEKLGAALKTGCVIALFGQVGAGKTAFTRGLARGLDCAERVTSPTFSIVNEYHGRLKICHFDMYRITGADELYDIGWEEYISSGAVCVVEWSENIENILPDNAIRVKITPVSENERIIEISGTDMDFSGSLA